MTYRVATRADLDLALTWAAQEGWNPGHEDAAAFHAADPDGFFVAERDGAPIAAISVVNHNPGFAFLGLYICLPAHRGIGIGYGLWQHALAHADDRVVGLDGVPDQQANYQCSGFVLASETYRFEGQFAADDTADLRRATPSDIPALAAMEAAANGYSKPVFADAWLRPAQTRTTHILQKDGTIHGFATVRICRDGAKIGPLVARDIDSARVLTSGIASLYPDTRLIIDVPNDQTSLTRLCEDSGLLASFNTARMYRGQAPQPGPHIRSIATMELG